MAKRKTKNEIEITSNETTIENKENNNVNKESKENKENTDNKNNKTIKKNTNENKTEYIITKKTEGVYIRKLRRL